jgi:uncharacterized phage protein (TIGR01671 family)
MRETLFRGKTKDGKWAIGSYIHGAKHFIYVREDEQEYEVIPETVGQYTGIDDINGNKIFEGDIVSFGTEEEMYEMFREVLGLVVYESTRFCIRWFWWNYMHDKFILKETHDLNKYIEKDGSKCLKIFGNIIDNPELLEEEK